MLIFPFIWTGIRTWKLLTTSQTWGKRCWLPLVNVNTFMLCVWNLKPNWPVWIQKRNSSYCCAYRHKKQLKKKKKCFCYFLSILSKNCRHKTNWKFWLCMYSSLSLSLTHTQTHLFLSCWLHMYIIEKLVFFKCFVS